MAPPSSLPPRYAPQQSTLGQPRRSHRAPAVGTARALVLAAPLLLASLRVAAGARILAAPGAASDARGVARGVHEVPSASALETRGFFFGSRKVAGPPAQAPSSITGDAPPQASPASAPPAGGDRAGRKEAGAPGSAVPAGIEEREWVMLESAGEADLRKMVIELKAENERVRLEAMNMNLQLAEKQGQLAQVKDENAILLAESARLEGELFSCERKLSGTTEGNRTALHRRQARVAEPREEEDAEEADEEPEEGSWNVTQVLWNLASVMTNGRHGGGSH